MISSLSDSQKFHQGFVVVVGVVPLCVFLFFFVFCVWKNPLYVLFNCINQLLAPLMNNSHNSRGCYSCMVWYNKSLLFFSQQNVSCFTDSSVTRSLTAGLPPKVNCSVSPARIVELMSCRFWFWFSRVLLGHERNCLVSFLSDGQVLYTVQI